ncbi:hypothetical protein [Polynucleobacter sp. AM-7D1]|uniref:hypothetical protein n=1 Tax=Polynucleobacter sp. AM-7D1 TaxID=2689102 RepID=UPI001BFE0002|nr:hypothetical protein [Polynucleobacter sp. AM-7D1]QWE28992.1 hypothetical protein GQ359_01550 [Polynucleobacter sp. AM-7D1]
MNIKFIKSKLIIRWLIGYIKEIFFFIALLKIKKILKIKPILESYTVKVFLPLIECNHYQFKHLLYLMKALELRGAQIKVLICDGMLTGCEIKSIRNVENKNPCHTCKFNRKHFLPMFKYDYINLSELIDDKDLSEIDAETNEIMSHWDGNLNIDDMGIKRDVEDSVLRYYYGAIPEKNSAVKQVWFAHTRTALVAKKAAQKIDATWCPDQVISNMAVYSAWGPFFRHFKSSNRFKLISLTQFDFNSIVINIFELFPAKKRFLEYLTERRGVPLSGKECELLYQFINNRKDGASEIFKKDNYFLNNDYQTNLIKKLKINKINRNLFIFSNVHWDVGLSSRGNLFNGVIDWVLSTIEIVKNETNTHIYIKPHPAEAYGGTASAFGVADAIKKKYPEGLKNITLIDPSMKINTYELFPYIDLGIIFNGTLGLEMALDDIEVVSAGLTSHQDLGFCHEPNTLKEYSEILKGNGEPLHINREQLKLFSFFYFLRCLYPWTLTKTVYGDINGAIQFKTLDEIEPGRDRKLDYLCDYLLGKSAANLESWPA